MCIMKKKYLFLVFLCSFLSKDNTSYALESDESNDQRLGQRHRGFKPEKEPDDSLEHEVSTDGKGPFLYDKKRDMFYVGTDLDSDTAQGGIHISAPFLEESSAQGLVYLLLHPSKDRMEGNLGDLEDRDSGVEGPCSMDVDEKALQEKAAISPLPPEDQKKDIKKNPSKKKAFSKKSKNKNGKKRNKHGKK